MTSAIARRVIQRFQDRGDEKRSLEVLSPRESEIIKLVAKGYIYKEIADQLGIGVETVRTHLHNVYLKLHVKNKGEAVAMFYGKR
jgi:DNA-binding CsgD family transcriptional regulator